MIATALFPSAFDQVAEDLAEMIRMRKEQKNDSTAAIILGGNFVGLRQYFDKKISGSLDEDELDRVAEIFRDKLSEEYEFLDEDEEE